jgi:hypothetical protein
MGAERRSVSRRLINASIATSVRGEQVEQLHRRAAAHRVAQESGYATPAERA